MDKFLLQEKLRDVSVIFLMLSSNLANEDYDIEKTTNTATIEINRIQDFLKKWNKD